jgi:hypothetical protein
MAITANDATSSGPKLRNPPAPARPPLAHGAGVRTGHKSRAPHTLSAPPGGARGTAGGGAGAGKVF